MRCSVVSAADAPPCIASKPCRIGPSFAPSAAINAATDAGDRRRFAVLHGVSVAITLAHIGAAGVVLARFLP